MPSRFDVFVAAPPPPPPPPDICILFPTLVVIEGLEDTVVVACVEAGVLDEKLPLPLFTPPPPPTPFILLVVCVKADVTVGN